MPTGTLVILLLIHFAVVAAITLTVPALRRWQRKVWLRERGDNVRGFEVKVRSEK